jgi:ABC-type phosphate transport system substrate-binding protein
MAMVAGALVSALMVTVGPFQGPPATAATDPTTLSGQGGSFFEPVVSKLLKDDAANMKPLYGAYLQTDINAGISAFVGTAPGQFGADFALTERPLTAAESAQAKADGRSYAYVPIASTPVAIGTLVPTTAWEQEGSTTISSSDFCLHMPLDLTQLADLYGFDATQPLSHWYDSTDPTRIICPGPGGGTTAVAEPVSVWANLDPSFANYALMALLDSTPASQAVFQAGLNQPGSLTQSTTPSTAWPYAANTIPGGDQPFIGKLLGINPETNVPSNQAGAWTLGATFPISSVWTASPLGVPWNISTAAVENAAGQDVAPSLAAAQAAEAHTTLAATSDPTTNNLVTFNPSATDAGAYNSFLMAEEYLVVPTNGLPANKANALAQFVRFALGTQGQDDIENFGAAPATAAERTAGLAVAAELNASAVAAASPTGSLATTSATPATTATSATTVPASTAGTSDSSTPSSDPSAGTDDSSASSGDLAFTGASPYLGVLIVTGGGLLLVGAVLRRRLKRSGGRS